MGDPLTSAVVTHVACSEHGPTDHFSPIAFEGLDFREEWLRAYETTDLINGAQNPLTADGTYLVRFGNCDPAKATFRPLASPMAVYVHSGLLHLMVGYSADGARPLFSTRVVLGKGSRFELVQRGTWYAMAPIGTPVLTLIGVRPRYDRIVDDVRSLPAQAIRAIAHATVDL